MACEDCGADVSMRGVRVHQQQPRCQVGGHLRRYADRGMEPISLDQRSLMVDLGIEHEVAPATLRHPGLQILDGLYVPTWVAHCFRYVRCSPAQRRALLADPEAARAAAAAGRMALGDRPRTRAAAPGRLGGHR